MRKIFNVRNFFSLFFMVTVIFSCQKNSSRNNTSLTGWSNKDKINAGFSGTGNYKGQKTPPGMVLVEGGTFIMGQVQDDVMFDWNTTPVKQQVRSFYMDETEVTNHEYRFYLEYQADVYPKSDALYKDIYQSFVPDTLVWRDVLGFNELLTENYFRHPSYDNYPVVGVSWVQASRYCKWRTDRVNEKILFKEGVIKDLYAEDSLRPKGQNSFNTDTYLENPYMLFEGDSTVYDTGKNSRGNKNSNGQISISDGLLTAKFRLPTESEWEYAAKANIGNREFNTIRGRKKYAWDSKYTRNSSKNERGDQLANFKLSKGDYSGLAGWSNDNADISNAVGSYEPNSYGLYDMSGNVSEWVADVYRPIIDNDANDFNYFRGNIFAKKYINFEGKVVIVDDNSVEYDTLDNGNLIPKELPGAIKYIPITKRDAYMRNNYEKAYNIDAQDGDVASTKFYESDEEDLYVKPRMYNSPEIPVEIDEDGNFMQTYDDKVRNTLISNKTRVYKGGSWKDRAYWLDPAQRRYLPEYMASNSIGFRCATDRFGSMSSDTKKRPTSSR